jgi:hypothetical protein
MNKTAAWEFAFCLTDISFCNSFNAQIGSMLR